MADRPTLGYKTTEQLYVAARSGEREFILHYHQRPPQRITGISLGVGCVWVAAGRMLPVSILADGSSKDGPAIWLEAVASERAAQGGAS